MRTKPSLATTVLTALFAATGCNAILGNDHGSLADDDAGAVDGSTTDAGLAADTNSAGDTTLPPPPPDAGTADAGPCPAAQKLCYGQCVSTSDPLYGCDVDACTPCRTNRAASICVAGSCAIGACDTGYADCNQKAADGCETDLSLTSHCGSCNAVCQVAAPYCAPAGGSFACSTNCPAQAPTLCGTQCVDLATSASHCGDCNTACPAVANGAESCVARVCQLACNTGFHACGGACASNVDPGTCGGSCTPCATPPNATATCTTGACGFACTAGFADCDKVAANGCESDPMSDPLNCGGCGHSCSGNACKQGQCQVPDAGPPDTGAPDAADADVGPG